MQALETAALIALYMIDGGKISRIPPVRRRRSYGQHFSR